MNSGNSKKLDSFTGAKINFVAEQTGVPESEFKEEAVELFQRQNKELRAYLALVEYDNVEYSDVEYSEKGTLPFIPIRTILARTGLRSTSRVAIWELKGSAPFTLSLHLYPLFPVLSPRQQGL